MNPARMVLVASVVPALLGPAAGARADGPASVQVVADSSGQRLQVDGRDFMVLGVNWDYVPIGENYLYSLWNQSDDVITAALDREMPLLQAMGVNTIRQYVGIPPRWVRYIHDRYGIYTVLNHPMGRYGFTVNGVWHPTVDYSDPALREAVTAEILDMVDAFRDTPGVLLWLLGNENNYGLSWKSAEVEALPEGERDAARARHLYSLYGAIASAIHERDSLRPVAMANGDVQYIDIIAEECRAIDVFGANVYRGVSARDLFQVVEDKLGRPVLFTEFGADAWNAREMREDQTAQARHLIGQWKEIYEQSAGKGRVGNAIGGLVFQWADGWWKFGQEDRLDIHDTNASWPNGGYPEDYVEGYNNMNEEWWGICAKGPADHRGLYTLYPRAAYYALRQAWQLAPYAPGTDAAAIAAHFAAVDPVLLTLQARGDRADQATSALDRLRVSSLRLEFETYSTGGARTSTPPAEEPQNAFPSFRGFDHLQSFWAGFQARPSDNVIADLSLNILGNVPVNPIDEIFYENRGRSRTLVLADGDIAPLDDIERVKVYRASVSWDEPWFQLDGYYRVGHTHWGYDGDFFGIYRDAFYGENLDTYNGIAPVGATISGKRSLSGLTVAFGPELHWGANPSVVLKGTRAVGPFQATAVYQDEFAEENQDAATSSAIPLPPTRRGTLHLATDWRGMGVEVGGIWAGSTKVGEGFQIAEEDGNGYRLLQDHVRDSDVWGAKGKLTLERGKFHWYAQGAYAGIVADGGPDATVTYTGWSLKDTGLGNGTNLMSGIAVNQGSFQIGPNVLWQKPLVGPVPGDVPSPGRPRNVLDDPFAVRANREMTAGEIMLTYDPTPATWMWAWDNDTREDSRLAASLGFVYRHYATTQDAAIGILANGESFAFPGAPPARDLWETNLRLVSRLSPVSRLVGHAYLGTGEPNGDDPRLIHRFGADARCTVESMAFAGSVKVNDWGPYDYHRDFNLTFPLQVMADVSHSLGTPRWFDYAQTRFGVRGTIRTLDQYSPRYCPVDVLDPAGAPVCDPAPGYATGNEWEIRTYLHIAM